MITYLVGNNTYQIFVTTAISSPTLPHLTGRLSYWHSLNRDNKPLRNRLGFVKYPLCQHMLKTSSLFLTFSHEVNQVKARGPARDCFINPLMIHVVETCRLEIIQYYHEASNELNIGSRILEFDSPWQWDKSWKCWPRTARRLQWREPKRQRRSRRWPRRFWGGRWSAGGAHNKTLRRKRKFFLKSGQRGTGNQTVDDTKIWGKRESNII